jgi:hypothetical protein
MYLRRFSVALLLLDFSLSLCLDWFITDLDDAGSRIAGHGQFFDPVRFFTAPERRVF